MRVMRFIELLLWYQRGDYMRGVSRGLHGLRGLNPCNPRNPRLWCMLPRMPTRYASFVVAFVILVAPLSAQWIKYPSAGVPRKADGSVNMSEPTPRMANGKPDLSGIWMTGETNNPRAGELSSPNNPPGPRPAQTADDKPGDPTAIRASRHMANIGVDIPGG